MVRGTVVSFWMASDSLTGGDVRAEWFEGQVNSVQTFPEKGVFFPNSQQGDVRIQQRAWLSTLC